MTRVGDSGEDSLLITRVGDRGESLGEILLASCGRRRRRRRRRRELAGPVGLVDKRPRRDYESSQGVRWVRGKRGTAKVS